jgi:transposase-like protein DUF772
MEWLDFDLLFRWFVGLGIDDSVWDHSVFSKNRDRLLTTISRRLAKLANHHDHAQPSSSPLARLFGRLITMTPDGQMPGAVKRPGS